MGLAAAAWPTSDQFLFSKSLSLFEDLASRGEPYADDRNRTLSIGYPEFP